MQSQTHVHSGTLVGEGKTKRIYEAEGIAGFCIVESKDDITAGDGKRHDVVAGKGALVNAVACNIFQFLKKLGEHVAFAGQVSDIRFLAPLCEMIPLEVVVRAKRHGSYCKRFPLFAEGSALPQTIVELYLKTSGKKWREYDLPCDDPLMGKGSEKGLLGLYHPGKASGECFLELSADEVVTKQPDSDNLLFGIKRRALAYFSFLREEFSLQGETLYTRGPDLADLKMEFGFHTGELFLADVISPDEWRLVDNKGYHLDKEPYRRGAPIDYILPTYGRVAEITNRFPT